MRRALAAFPAILALSANAPPNAERCLAASYQLPEFIGGELRPYLICGLLRGRDGHFTVRLNGVAVSVNGGAPDMCDRLRRDAALGAETRLVAIMPNLNERQSFVAPELEKLDRYLAVAASSEDLGVGDEPADAPCRTSKAQN